MIERDVSIVSRIWNSDYFRARKVIWKDREARDFASSSQVRNSYRVAIAKCEINVYRRGEDAEFKGFARLTVASGAVVVQWICVADCCESAWSFLAISGSRGLRMAPVKILGIYLLFMVMCADGGDVIEERGSYLFCSSSTQCIFENPAIDDGEIFSENENLSQVYVKLYYQLDESVIFERNAHELTDSLKQNIWH